MKLSTNIVSQVHLKPGHHIATTKGKRALCFISKVNARWFTHELCSTTTHTEARECSIGRWRFLSIYRWTMTAWVIKLSFDVCPEKILWNTPKKNTTLQEIAGKIQKFQFGGEIRGFYKTIFIRTFVSVGWVNLNCAAIFNFTNPAFEPFALNLIPVFVPPTAVYLMSKQDQRKTINPVKNTPFNYSGKPFSRPSSVFQPTQSDPVPSSWSR